MSILEELVELTEVIATRIRNGKKVRIKSRRKRIITGSEKARRKKGARVGARKRRAKAASSLRKRRKSLGKRKRMGIKTTKVGKRLTTR